MTTPEIRAARPGDLSQLLVLLRAKAAFDGGVELLKATPEEIDSALFGDRPRVSVIVAEGSDKLVGMATYFETFSTFLAKPCLWLDDLFVDSNYRSHGIGRLLLSELARVAQGLGAARIEWSVSAKNDRGQDFYRRAGATIRNGAKLVRLDEASIADLANAAEGN